MAYVRRRGNQVAIVHGERQRETGKVQQRILFTLYSKDEAREALGLGAKGAGQAFRRLLEAQYPGIHFKWDKVERDLQANLHILPDEYAYREARLQGTFRRDLCAFVRQLVLADPRTLHAAGELLREQRHELEYVRDLVQMHLSRPKEEKTPLNAGDRFFWTFELSGCRVPPDAEELALRYYEEGDLERARAAFGLLVECFEGYADGHNHLGVIALERDDLQAAVEHFRKATESGRHLFPRRMGKKQYWRDTSTRPYMRGLRNLAGGLLRAGEYEEALDVCRRLERECGDRGTAEETRAGVYLNVGRWGDAIEAALRVNQVIPTASFVAAFALQERGQREAALVWLLHAGIQLPATARILAGLPGAAPRSREEAEDIATGKELLRDLRGYLTSYPAGRTFFRRVLRSDRVQAILDEAVNVVRRWHHQVEKGSREAIERMHEMRTIKYARDRAREVFRILFPNIAKKRGPKAGGT